MRRKPGARPPGQIRQSQLISTFGPGAMLDLPTHSVLVGGLEFWSAGGVEVVERRLSEKLAELLGVSSLRLMTPPPDLDDPTVPSTGIDAFQFPEWFITQDFEPNEDNAASRSRMLVHRKALSKGKFNDRDKKKRAVVPVRFVRACPAGHISDIDWRGFVDGGPSDCRRQMWIDERGTSGDLGEVWIRCECKAVRNMAQDAKHQNWALGKCEGLRPWLGPLTKEDCGVPSRLLIRTASNAYFPEKMTVISLPERDDTVKQAIDAAWEYLEAVEDLNQLQYERRKAKVKAALAGIGDDKPDGNFFARSLPRAEWDRPWMKCFERIVLVHRLREVVAQVGFTRFAAPTTDAEGELAMGVERASLAREITWLPAVENKGEGVFLQFSDGAIATWAARGTIQDRTRRLSAGFDCWAAEHQGTRRVFPGPGYVMMHSFSHGATMSDL